MAHYILLMTLTPEGRQQMLRNSEAVVEAVNSVHEHDVEHLGLYAVLGDYDFVHIVHAPDNEAVARYALELGVRAGVHTATLPAVPVAQLQEPANEDDFGESARAAPPNWLQREREG